MPTKGGVTYESITAWPDVRYNELRQQHTTYKDLFSIKNIQKVETNTNMNDKLTMSHTDDVPRHRICNSTMLDTS